MSSAKPNAPGEFLWYELMTNDGAGAAAFYASVLGWRARAVENSPINYRLVEAGAGDVGGILEIAKGEHCPGGRPAWVGYIAVEDVDATAAAIVKDGAAQYMAPMDIPGVGRIAMFADPQGAMFYIMRGAVLDGRSNSFAPDKRGHCHWNELSAADPAAALAFYARFGWEKGDVMPMGPAGDYQFLTHQGVTIGALMPCMDERPPRWRFYFGVADIDAAADAVNASGGAVLHGPEPVPTGDYIVIGADPQGAEFGLVGPRRG